MFLTHDETDLSHRKKIILNLSKIQVLRRGLGWSDVELKSVIGKNRYSGTNRMSDMSEKDLKIIRDANLLDVKLYDYAKTLAYSDRTFFDALSDGVDDDFTVDDVKRTEGNIQRWMSMDVPCQKKCGHVCSVHFEFNK